MRMKMVCLGDVHVKRVMRTLLLLFYYYFLRRSHAIKTQFMSGIEKEVFGDLFYLFHLAGTEGKPQENIL